ncbi:hypothetical protein [Subtercola sp. YIM 133946]|uniref:hypothetical protein n=1 Tax=Subtercola sp. YIM 133946 TaxID=3118909 RepID=UPI002F9463BE
MPYVAYVDESEPDQSVDPGTYILCAAIIAVDEQDEPRRVMRGLRRLDLRKVHWHEESPRGRQALIASVAALKAEHLIVVRLGGAETRSERRRRLCLERLCCELTELGVENIVLESRGPADKLDRALVDSLRAKRVLSSSVRIDHVAGPAEPLLWIADIMCGAVAQDRRGRPAYLEQLRSTVTIVEI